MKSMQLLMVGALLLGQGVGNVWAEGADRAIVAANPSQEKMDRMLTEIKGLEKELMRVGIKFGHKEIDVDYLAKARKKTGNRYDMILAETRIDLYDLTLRRFIELFKDSATQELLLSFQGRIDLLKDRKNFFATIWEASSGFLDYCEGRTNLAGAHETAQYVMHEMGASDCQMADELLDSKTELTIQEEEMNEPLRTLAPLRDAKRLSVLTINGDKTKKHEGALDFSPLSALVHFQTLNIEHFKVDPAGINKAKKLKNLKLVDCGIRDIAPLAPMTTLRDVNLDKNGIEDLSPLSTLKFTAFSAEENPLHVCPVEAASKKLEEFCKKVQAAIPAHG